MGVSGGEGVGEEAFGKGMGGDCVFGDGGHGEKAEKTDSLICDKYGVWRALSDFSDLCGETK